MTGALIELVSNNSVSNQWITEQPEITMFKIVYRRHTNFGSELIKIPFGSVPTFGSGVKATILPKGDLLNRIMIVLQLPTLKAKFTKSKSQDISNLINQSQITNHKLKNNLLSTISNNSCQKITIEYPKLFEIINSTKNQYQYQKYILTEMIKQIQNTEISFFESDQNFVQRVYDIFETGSSPEINLFKHINTLKKYYEKDHNLNPIICFKKNLSKTFTDIHKIKFDMVNKFRGNIHPDILTFMGKKYGKDTWNLLLSNNILEKKLEVQDNLNENSFPLIRDSHMILINFIKSMHQNKPLLIYLSQINSSYIDQESKNHFTKIFFQNLVSKEILSTPLFSTINNELSNLFDRIDHKIKSTFKDKNLNIQYSNQKNLTSWIKNLLGLIKNISPDLFISTIKSYVQPIQEIQIKKIICLINDSVFDPDLVLDLSHNIGIMRDSISYFRIDHTRNLSKNIFDRINQIIYLNTNTLSKVAINILNQLYGGIQIYLDEILYGRVPRLFSGDSLNKRIWDFISGIEFHTRGSEGLTYFKIEKIVCDEIKVFYSRVLQTDIHDRKYLIDMLRELTRVGTNSNHYDYTKIKNVNNIDKSYGANPHTICLGYLHAIKESYEDISSLLKEAAEYIPDKRISLNISGINLIIKELEDIYYSDLDIDSATSCSNIIECIYREFNLYLKQYLRYVIYANRTTNLKEYDIESAIQDIYADISEKNFEFVESFVCGISFSDIESLLDVDVFDYGDFLDMMLVCALRGVLGYDYMDILEERDINSFIMDFICEKSSNMSKSIDARSKLLKNILEYLQKGVILYDLYDDELEKIKKSVCDILYRNDDAHCAWIRKLGHFIVTDLQVWANDQIIDSNDSDWLEIYHEIGRYDGQTHGYDKMIGNVPKLYAYTTQAKISYTLVIPLIFYFCRSPASSIPMTAGMNTTINLKLRIRRLNEVAHKEIYSEFIDINGQTTTPEIIDGYVMAEYYYLTTEERMFFCKGLTEYIMEELQIDNTTTLSDHNLKPIYQVNFQEREYDILTNGIKTRVTEPNPKTFELVDSIFRTENSFVPRSDRVYVKITDDPTSVSCSKLIARKICLQTPNGKNIPSSIFCKRIDHRYYFGNPSEFMSVVFRPVAHINPLIRNNFKTTDYFYGEYQWANYGLYPWFSHQKISDAKNQNYQKTCQRVNSILGVKNNLKKLFGSKYLISNHVSDYHNKDLIIVFETILRFRDCVRIHSFSEYNEIMLMLENGIWGRRSGSYPIGKEDFVTELVGQGIERGCALEAFELFAEKLIFRFCSDLIKKIKFGGKIESGYLSVGILIKRCDRMSVKGVSILYDMMNHWIKFITIEPIQNLFYKSVLVGMIGDDMNFRYNELVIVAAELNIYENDMISDMYVPLIDFEKSLIRIEGINPMRRGLLKFNNYERNPVNSFGEYWSYIQPYWNALHTPSVGINIYSWVFDIFSRMHAGTANLSKIDNFTGEYDIHPLISDDYPAEMITHLQSLNLNRYLSGQSGKAWTYTSANFRGINS